MKTSINFVIYAIDRTDISATHHIDLIEYGISQQSFDGTIAQVMLWAGEITRQTVSNTIPSARAKTNITVQINRLS